MQISTSASSQWMRLDAWANVPTRSAQWNAGARMELLAIPAQKVAVSGLNPLEVSSLSTRPVAHFLDANNKAQPNVAAVSSN